MTVACTFGPLRIQYDDRVLAPRAWTLTQSRHAVTALDRGPDGPILELHCGAGHIGQATAAWSGRPLVQVDDDPAACEWARTNAAGNGLTADVWCTSVDALEGEAGAFALVLADPPYVPAVEIVRFHDDPTHAIDGGPDGLAGFRACLPVAARLTASTGSVVLQVRGPRQAAEVEDFVSECCPELRPTDAVTVGPDRTVMTFVHRVSLNRIHVAASPEAVFEVLDDACAYPRWVVGTRRIRAVDHDWPAEGSAFHHAIGSPGAELHDLSRVVHRDAPHQLVLEVKFRPTGTARVEVTVDPIAGGCDVVIREQPTSGPAKRVPAFVREPLLRLRNALSLHRLRREVEGARPGGS